MRSNVRFGSKADICSAKGHVRFTPKSGHRLSAKGHVWFWPKIAAALTSKHHWLIVACDSCDTVVDLDLSVKPRDPEASIRIALRDVRCPRCNGHGRPRICAVAVGLKHTGKGMPRARLEMAAGAPRRHGARPWAMRLRRNNLPGQSGG